MTHPSSDATTRRAHTGSDIPLPTVPAGVTLTPDVSYGEHERQRYDVYLPEKRDNLLPVVIFFHPGAWTRRDKRAVRTMFVLEHGYALVSIGYRLAQHAKFPAQIQDANRGIAHVLERAEEYGLDRNRVFLAGTSAGAHLASLVALARDQEDFLPVDRLKIAGVVSLYGAYDLSQLLADARSMEIDHLSEDSPLQTLLGARPLERPDLVSRASPKTYVRPDSPPFLIMHGRDDIVLPASQSESFAAMLADSNIACELEIVAGAGHGDEVFRRPPISDRIVAWLDAHLQDPDASKSLG